MKPLISVVVPVYNAGPFLRPCLDSILAQTYRPIEILLVEDCSTDGSREVCEEYTRAHYFIKLLPGVKKGANAGRALGAAAAKGDFVWFCDSDDLTHPKLLETLFHAICVTGLPAACCSHDTFDTVPPKDSDKPAPAPEALRGNDALNALLHDKRMDWGLWNKLYLRDYLLPEVFNTPITYNEDLYTNWLLLRQIPGMALTDFCAYHYRQHTSSISRRALDEKQLSDQLWVADQILKDSKSTPLAESAEAFRYEKLLYLYSLILRQPDASPFAATAEAYRAQIREAYPTMKNNSYLSRRMKRAALASGWFSAPYGWLCRRFLERR